MTKTAKTWVCRIYEAVLSLSLVAAGVCLAVACLQIYYAGNGYSREAVAAAFAPIALPVYGCLGLLVGGFVLSAVFPAEEGRMKATPDAEARLARLYARTDIQTWDETQRRSVEREQSRRRALCWARVGLWVAATAVFLVYALNPGHFSSSDVTGSVTAAMAWLLPCCLIPCGFDVFARYATLASLRQETGAVNRQLVAQVVTKEEAFRKMPAEIEKDEPDEMVAFRPAEKPSRLSVERLVRYGLLTAGLALLIYGFATGGIADVLTKAVNICTECIGLG